MPTLGSYCKAYPITRFQDYANWTENPVQTPTPSATSKTGTAQEAEGAPEERYLFLQENLIVTDGIFLDQNIVFDAVTPEWEQFCRSL